MQRPKTTLLVLLVLGLVLGAGLTRLGFDPTTEKVFPQGHEAVETYQAFREAFGGDEAVFLAFEMPPGQDVFAREALELSRALSAAAGELEGVEQSFALADMPVLQLTPQGPRLVPGLPADLDQAQDKDLARFERAIERLPLVGKMLVSKDR
ncbi:MAG TPA: hypothetical protein DEA08_21535, partial [Planctomycetes bacterium]|nr:hypothetical protein [Planctomycetota bacterium]